jgi:hypothetical protein
MPNGRSGGFPLQTADLKQLIADSPQVGSIALIVDGAPPFRLATASELAPWVAGVNHDHVAVEEQHGTSYIIHLSNEPIRWICVEPDSPLLVPLHQHHARWKAANPGWNDWIAF